MREYFVLQLVECSSVCFKKKELLLSARINRHTHNTSPLPSRSGLDILVMQPGIVLPALLTANPFVILLMACGPVDSLIPYACERHARTGGQEILTNTRKKNGQNMLNFYPLPLPLIKENENNNTIPPKWECRATRNTR